MNGLLGIITGSDKSDAKTMVEIEVELYLIDEDPNNPRKFLSDRKEEEMIESIKQRGILQPIVIVPNSDGSGRYTVKDGNRRRRNALMAGLKSIPAIIKPEFNELDQLTANIVRDDMTIFDLSRSINNLIREKVAKQKEIGKALGFIEAKTSKIVALTKDVHPEIIEQLEHLHNRDLAKDFSAMYEIVTLSKDHQEDVIKWLKKHVASGKSLGIADVKKLKAKLTIDCESTDEKSSPANYDEKIIVDIAVKGKDSMDRISKLSKGEIIDPEERNEVLNEIAELITDLKIIHKQYK